MWQVHFVLTILFLLTLASDMTVLYGNNTFLVSVLSTKKWDSKVKVLKTFKIPSDCHIKKCQKSIVPFFRRTYALSVGFKMKPLKNAFSGVMVKTNLNCALKVAERSNRFLPVYLMNHFAQTFILFNMSLRQHLLFNRTYFVNTWKMSDVTKLLFQ